MNHATMHTADTLGVIGRRLGAAAALAAMLLAGCAVTPPASVHQPMTARPAPLSVAPVANGAIYQVQQAAQPGYVNRPLFEDRRARAVGDILTISISETTSASKKSSSTAGRGGSTNAAVTGLSGLPGKSLLGSNVAATSSSAFEGKGDSASNNVFTGTVTVTVIEVLPNGNLLVSGEKQLGINQGSEFVRFSGIVNPASVSASNTVSSTLVADARIEYRGNGYIDEAQTMGWLGRFFMSVLPF
jgi:flagellar L-ring protein precursor FlgH